ncbi:hypothetical protein HDU67_000888 [Dinochytrium kinnereticum]|nr:hypothetical protein HDU67_000888 [Dinochytrium kinnereticum]
MLARRLHLRLPFRPVRLYTVATFPLQPITLHPNFLEIPSITIGLTEPTTRFHYRWLRHNCSCQTNPHGCRHPKTGERIIDSLDVSENIFPKSVEWRQNGLSVVWDDGHVSFYTGDWLREYAYDRPGGECSHLAQMSKVAAGKGVGIAGLEELEIDFKSLLERFGVKRIEGETLNARNGNAWADEYRRMMLNRMESFGAVVVKGRGMDTEAIIHDFLPPGKDVIHTHFGRIEDLMPSKNTTNQNTDQLGYTGSEVEVHTDQPFIPNPPGFQMLHGIKPSERYGEGDSLLVDMKAVSDFMRENHEEEWSLLTTVKVSFDRRQKKFRSCEVRPILDVDEMGNLRQVRYSYFTHAYDTLAKIVRDPNSPFRMQFRLESGDLILYDNHRMLHGRTAFKGFRHSNEPSLSDGIVLRSKHRILGQWSGSLPAHPSQNQFMGLPLTLCLEEVVALWMEGLITILDDRESHQPVCVEDLVKHAGMLRVEEERRDKSREVKSERSIAKDVESETKVDMGGRGSLDSVEGSEVFMTASEHDLLDSSSSSLVVISDHPVTETTIPTSAEKSKMDLNPPPKSSVHNRMTSMAEKKPPFTSSSSTAPLSLGPRTASSASPWYRPVPLSEEKWIKFLNELTELETTRCLVFWGIWKRGLVDIVEGYLMSGVKFGGDFLIYPELIPVLDLVAMARVARGTKKRRLLCSWDGPLNLVKVKTGDSKGNVVVFGYEWTGWR